MSRVGEGRWGVLRRSGSGEGDGDSQQLSFFLTLNGLMAVWADRSGQTGAGLSYLTSV